MTRTVRARRAERANLPLYARMLRLRHLAPSGLLCFVFLEGAVVLGILLALAELVSWWGVIVLPVTVALMVKFNDLVAGAIVPRPVATEATSARATVLRPAAMSTASEDSSSAEQTVVLRAPVSGAERGGGFGPAGAAFSRVAGGPPRSAEWSGVYGSSGAGRSGAYGPVSGSRGPVPGGRGTYGPASGERPGVHGDRPGVRGERPGIHADRPGVPGPGSVERAGAFGPVSTEYSFSPVSAERSFGTGRSYGPISGGPVGGQEPDDRADGFTPAAPVTGGFTPAGMPLAGGYAPIVTPEPSSRGYEPGAATDGMSEAPAVGYPGSYSRGLSGGDYSSGAGGYGDEGQVPVRSAVDPAVEEPRVTNAPVRRAWADELDVRQQMARQAASRRYE